MQNSKMFNNKNGFATELFVILVVGIVIVLFFGGWIYASNLVNTELLSIQGDGTEGTNLSYISQQNFSYYVVGLQELKLIAGLLILAYMFATLIMSYFTGRYPILFFLYICLAVILIIMSVYISNVYEDMLTNDTLGTTLQTFTLANHLLLNLTMYMTIITFLGITISMIGMFLWRDNTA